MALLTSIYSWIIVGNAGIKKRIDAAIRVLYQYQVRPSWCLSVANLFSREEYAYAHGVACWPHMYYRIEEELLEMLNAAGFSDIWSGACGLYTFWVAQR